jgi:predicted permease
VPFAAKLSVIAGVIALAMTAGYLARRTGLLREGAARRIMTFVAAAGYPPVGLLTIWNLPLRGSDAVLPVLAAAHAAAMIAVGWAASRLVTRDRPERGLFALASGVANHGPTMGGFVLFLLFGEAGLARSSIYTLMFWPMVVFLAYPIARRFAGGRPETSLGRLYLRSVFDFRSIGLATSAGGIALSASGVPRPAFVSDCHVVDVLVFVLVASAYFGIGLRLHLSQVGRAWRLIAGLTAVRFGCGLAVGSAIAAATQWTPWPLSGLGRSVFLVQAFVPTAVMLVAMGNMFGLRPRTASVLFVTNTLLYLAAVLPFVLWAFGT